MHEAGHFPPSSAEFENAWSFISTFLICLKGMHKDSFTLLYFTLLKNKHYGLLER